ncbi:MAG: Hpt domain-containing protein, partial [Desulfamplus sp.]|nr:Hpt domain-containing protein [Desulfamplus sp.]
LPIFDKSGFMQRIMDDDSLASMLIDVFIEDVPEQIEILKGYIHSGDTHKTELQAHSIKGACANIGGEAMRELAYRMEKLAKSGDMVKVNSLMSELESEFKLLKEAIGKGMLSI